MEGRGWKAGVHPVSEVELDHQIAAFVGHLDRRTTRRYSHLMPKDKRATVESIPFEFYWEYTMAQDCREQVCFGTNHGRKTSYRQSRP